MHSHESIHAQLYTRKQLNSTNIIELNEKSYLKNMRLGDLALFFVTVDSKVHMLGFWQLVTVGVRWSRGEPEPAVT